MIHSLSGQVIMSASDATLHGLTVAQQMAEEEEDALCAWPSMFGPGGFGVPRILPPGPPRPRRTWEQVVEDTARIQADYLKLRRSN